MQADDNTHDAVAEPGADGSAPLPPEEWDLVERTFAARIAQELQNEIVRRRWPIGEALGSEAELMERFGASRSVVREARRILESRLVAKPKPGPGGGLVITAPDIRAFAEVARLVLDYRGFQPQDLFDVWVALEIKLVRRVAETITDEELDELNEIRLAMREATDPRAERRSMHTEIGRLSGNPIAELVLWVLSDLARFHSTWFDTDGRKRLSDMHVDLIDALRARDADLAVAHVERIFEELSNDEHFRLDYFYSPPTEDAREAGNLRPISPPSVG